jgi:stage II sporulation protein E
VENISDKRASESKKHESITEFIEFLVKNISVFVLSFVFSLGGKAGLFSPFGVSAVAAAGFSYMPVSILGASLGYIVTQNSLYSLRYIAAILACGVIMGTLKSLKDITSSKIFAPAITFVTLFITGLAIAFSETITLAPLLKFLTEALTGACGAYFIHAVSKMKISYKSIGYLSSKDLSALMITAGLLLLSLSSICIGEFVPIRVVAVLLVLICARYTHEAGGAIVGVCTGIALSISGENAGSLILAGYSFGGLLGGVFSQLGRVGTAAAFIVANGVIAIMEADNPAALPIVIEAAAATIIFLCLPKSATKKLEEMLSPACVSPVLDSVKNDIVLKLHNASKITEDIAESLISVSNTLKIGENSGITDMYTCIRAEVCDSCGLRDTCFEQNYDDTIGAFNDIVLMLRNGDRASFTTIPPHFASKCIRIDQLCDSFNRFYREYAANQKAQTKIAQVRNVVSDQFTGISYMLSSLSQELSEKTVFDIGAAQRITVAFEEMGVKVIDVCCAIDKYDRINTDIHIEQSSAKISKAKLRGTVEGILQRKLDMPIMNGFGDILHIAFKERPPYRIVTGFAQFAAGGERVCGDAFSCFTDDNGFFYLMLSDGMGTGAKAAVSSTLTVSICENLIKAGFGIEASLKAVNSALIVKPGDEMSVTIDIAAIDLYTGQISIYKAGAAATVVKRRGKCIKVEIPSLPLGILRDCECVSTKGTLEKSDIVLLTTDGVSDESLKDICKKLQSFKGGELAAYVRELAADAKNAYKGEKDDDITVVAAALVKD